MSSLCTFLFTGCSSGLIGAVDGLLGVVDELFGVVDELFGDSGGLPRSFPQKGRDEGRCQ